MVVIELAFSRTGWTVEDSTGVCGNCDSEKETVGTMNEMTVKFMHVEVIHELQVDIPNLEPHRISVF
jgi:predicted phosphodiesterase